ncbi:MAG: response regulator [Pirellulaceae bacterium]
MVAAVKRVLVVDDEEIVRESYKLALTEAGYEVRTVPNGREALRACRSEHFDVMLADIRMPDMDGLEVSQVVVHEFPEVRVIVITGYPTPESAARARRLGVSDYLQKPVAPDRLSAATAAALALPVQRTREEVLPQMPDASGPREASPGLASESATSATQTAVPLPVQVTQTMGIPAPTTTKDISAATAFLVLLSSPLIGLAYFLLFPIVGTAIALTVLGKEIVKIFGIARQ